MSKNDDKLGGAMAVNIVLGGLAAIAALLLFSLIFALLISSEKVSYGGAGDYVLASAFISGVIGCIFFRIKNGKYNVLPGCLGVALFVAVIRLFAAMFKSGGSILSWDNLKVDIAVLAAAVIVGFIKAKKKRSRR